MLSKHRLGSDGISEANITPLADVTTTLIVVFLVTLPTLLWSGIEVQSKPVEKGSTTVVSAPAKDRVGLLTVAVNPDGLKVNDEDVTFADLGGELTRRLAKRENRTVVVVPHDRVKLGNVVSVLDVAKTSGATNLALLNLKDGGR